MPEVQNTPLVARRMEGCQVSDFVGEDQSNLTCKLINPTLLVDDLIHLEEISLNASSEMDNLELALMPCGPDTSELLDFLGIGYPTMLVDHKSKDKDEDDNDDWSDPIAKESAPD